MGVWRSLSEEKKISWMANWLQFSGILFNIAFWRWAGLPEISIVAVAMIPLAIGSLVIEALTPIPFAG